MKDNNLENLRKQIDQIDMQILKLLSERQQLVGKIAEFKMQSSMEIYQPARFEKMMQRLERKAKELGLRKNLIIKMWNLIHEDSLKQQKNNQ